jgi:hypothetical protein
MTPTAVCVPSDAAFAMPKSTSLTSPAVAHQHVLRRHVAVHDAQRVAAAVALAVRVVEAVGDISASR